MINPHDIDAQFEDYDAGRRRIDSLVGVYEATGRYVRSPRAHGGILVCKAPTSSAAARLAHALTIASIAAQDAPGLASALAALEPGPEPIGEHETDF